MTPPAALPPQCLLYVDGVRFDDGDTAAGLDGDPVALDGLVVTWGRSTILDQPAPASATFTVLDLPGGGSFRSRLVVGARIDILASTMIYGDPTLPAFTDPGFESGAFGGRVAGGSAAVVTTAPHTGTKCLRVEPAPGSRSVTVTIPPKGFSTDPVAWDAVPRAQAGQTWQGAAWVKLPQYLLDGSQVAYVQAVAFTHPDGRAPALVGPRVQVAGGAGVWQQVTLDGVVAPADSWLGVQVVIQPAGPGWDDLDPALTWDTVAPPALAWDDIGAVFVDDVNMLAPPAGALRQGAVFSGRITDLSAEYQLDAGGTLVKVIAQDDLAELANRYVGAAPWPAQTVAARVAAVIAAAAQPRLTATVDAGVQGRLLSYLDVDAQPAAGLLGPVAQSVGGALWVTTSVAAQATLRVEDVDARPAMLRLALVGGVVVIVVATSAVGGIELDACDVLLDPTRWVQDSTDMATQVAIGWREQTIDGDGLPAPTDRTVTRTDDALTATRGRFRVGISTELATGPDADQLAGVMLSRLSVGGWRIAGLVWQLDQLDLLDGPALSRVMQVLDGTTRVGLPVLLGNLPDWSPVGAGGRLPLYLEGGRFSNTAGVWRLELETTSAFNQGAADVAWDDLPAGWTWEMFDPGISWDDLAGVGI
jgi:hypothetical protein